MKTWRSCFLSIPLLGTLLTTGLAQPPTDNLLLWLRADAIAGLSPSDVVNVFRDNFNVSAPSPDVNFENAAGRQSGSAGVLAYLETTGGASDALSQVNAPDAPGQLRLEVTGAQVYTAVCPNHNFTEGGSFNVEFDLDAGVNDPAGTSGDWACVVFGASAPLAFVNASDGLGILFRNNGAIQVFDGAADTGGGALLPLGPLHVRLEVTTAGFEGTPATARLFVNGTQVQLGSASLDYTKATGFRGNYVTLGCYAAVGNTWVNTFDNLQITAVPCIRPSVGALKSFVGQTNQTVTVSIPSSLNAAAPVEVIVSSAQPAVAEPRGAVGGSLTLTFPAGGATAQSFAVAAHAKGSTVFTLAGPSGACVGGSVNVSVGATFVNNPSFEDNTLGGVGYGPIAGWTGPSGVNTAAQPFADNGRIPDRSQVAFIQGNGTLQQTVAGLVPGQNHWLQFRYNVRNCCGGTMGLNVRFAGVTLDTLNNIQPVGSTNAYRVRHISFVPATDSGLLEFAAVAAGDASLVLDAVTIVPRGTNQVPLLNPSFEASGDVPSPGTVSPAPIAGWTGSGNYGINRLGQEYADSGVNPDQDHVAFVRGMGWLSQTVSNLAIGQEYQIAYSASAFSVNEAALTVWMGGDLLLETSLLAVGPGEPYPRFTHTWIATATTAELKFEQFDDLGGALLLDDVQILGLAIPPCETTLSTSAFELFNRQPTADNLVTVTLPLYLVATQAVDVIVTSADPTIAVPAGATGGTLVLHLPAGLSNSVSFAITALRSGTVTFFVTNSVGCPGATFTVRNRTSLVLNPSFEDNGLDVWPGYGPIAAWTGPSGLNPITVDHPNGRSPFADNGVIPDRGQVAFMQVNAAEFKQLSQVIFGLNTNRQYWLQLYANARNCCGDFPNAAARFNGIELASVPAVVPVGGANPYYFVNLPFTPNASTGELALASGPTATGGDRTLLLDAVTLVQRDAGQVVLQNPSFEASGNPPWPGYVSPAPLAGWTGTGGYGVNLSGAGPFADNGVAPDQDNAAFLQGAGASLSQTVSGLTTGARYTLSYAYNARSGNSPQLTVTANGVVLQDEVLVPVGGTLPYHTTNVTFQASADTVTLVFRQSAEGDQTALLDDVRLVLAAPLEVRLTIQRVPPDSLRIAWPVAAGGDWTLLSAETLGGGWSDPGLPVWTEGDEHVVYDTASGSRKFYQLRR